MTHHQDPQAMAVMIDQNHHIKQLNPISEATVVAKADKEPVVLL